ncbi:tRNA lysidine(34) synthetase TilS [Prochlorococcus sp. MIT 1223]|uniref:tRNA lysidine(34) synthetase TilS n=1 Tax=Prochlorococcus sp. MIT 1223 TaxID=3096217 RepID=UPI002A75B1E5|nr:tRNA lysidine(34) synthetase TilS [Prochlorococcus sp. MIT 1223]
MSRYQKIQMPWTTWHHRLHNKLEKDIDLLPKGSCLLLSVSGGQDSMVLVKLLLDLQRLHKWELNVWHGDHGWHQESSSIAKELKDWCEKEKLPFFCDRATAKATKTENAAREWRYENLTKRALMISEDPTKKCCLHVLTGHTASDRAETLILNIARGSDLLGLTSLREKRVLQKDIQLVRPLLNFNRSETIKICEQLDLPIWVDPSNSNLNFRRNKIRYEILPILEELYTGCSTRIAALAERLSNYHATQSSLALLALKTIRHPKGLCRQELIAIPHYSRQTLIALWLSEHQVPGLSSNLLEEIANKTSRSKPPGSINLKTGWKIGWTREYLYLSKS